MGKVSTTASEKATIDPKDMEEFLELLASTGRKTTELSPQQDRVIQNDCWTWVQNGKPTAVMPEMKKKVEIIKKVYRVKRYGKQYLQYRNQDGVQGLTFEKTYEMVPKLDEHNKPTGEFVEDKDSVVATRPIYSIEYTKAYGEELVEQALKTALEPTFYIVQGKKFKVEAEDFNEDFDTMMKNCKRALSLKVTA